MFLVDILLNMHIHKHFLFGLNASFNVYVGVMQAER